MIGEQQLKPRAKLIQKFIATADQLRQLQNYNGLMAVLAGLNHISVQRLKKSWAVIASKYRDAFHRLEALMAPRSNYRAYRRLLKTSQPPVIPYLGVLLRDLTFIYDGNARWLDKEQGVVNFERMTMTWQQLRDLRHIQSHGYDSLNLADDRLCAYLSNLPTSIDEDELHHKSLQLEPPANHASFVASLQSSSTSDSETPSDSSDEPDTVESTPLALPDSPVADWSPDDVCRWVSSVCGKEFAAMFAQVKGPELVQLDNKSLLELGVNHLQKRKLLLRRIKLLLQDESELPTQSEVAEDQVFKSDCEAVKRKRPELWSVHEVVAWLHMQGFLEDHKSIFLECGVSGEVLLVLTANVLSEMGISRLGDRKRLIRHIRALKTRGGAVDAAAEEISARVRSHRARSFSSSPRSSRVHATGPTPLRLGRVQGQRSLQSFSITEIPEEKRQHRARVSSAPLPPSPRIKALSMFLVF